MKHYIYILSNPCNGDIFYVGCTKNPKERAQNHKYKTIKSLFNYRKPTEKDVYVLAMQQDPIFHVIEEVVGFTEVALIRESFWITFLAWKGFPLVNQKGRDLKINLKSELFGLPKNFSPIGIEAFDREVISEVSNDIAA